MCMPCPAVPEPAAQLDRAQSLLQGHHKCRLRLGSSALPLPTTSRSAKGHAPRHVLFSHSWAHPATVKPPGPRPLPLTLHTVQP